MAKARAKGKKKQQHKKQTPRRSARNQPASPKPNETPATQHEQQSPTKDVNIQDHQLSRQSKSSVNAPNLPVDRIDNLDKIDSLQDSTDNIHDLKTPEVVDISHTTEVSVIDKPLENIHLDMNDNDDPVPLLNPPKFNPSKTYADSLKDTSDTPLAHNLRHSKNTFLLAKRFNDHPSEFENPERIIYVTDPVKKSKANKQKKLAPKAPPIDDLDISDDDTVPQSNLTSMHRQRYRVNYQMPKKEEVSREDAVEWLIDRVNLMIKSVINKNKGVVLLPWILDDNAEISRDKVFTSFPTNDTDFCEKNLYGFTRFTKPEVFYKMRLHLAYPETVDPDELLRTTNGLFIIREQRFEPASSDASSPISAGTLTGSIKSMADSPDFHAVFKHFFKLQHLGLSWDFGRHTMKNTPYSSDLFKIHVEIGMEDKKQKQQMETYLYLILVIDPQFFWHTNATST